MEISSEEFERVLAEVARLSARWAQELDGRGIPAEMDGAGSDALFGGPLPEKGERMGALSALEGVLKGSRAQNGRFLGYVLGSGEPVAAEADLWRRHSTRTRRRGGRRPRRS
jgi:aromatic-L-amino-acid/L-tryptophan decarboxylase